MAVLLILASPPRTLRAIGGGSAAGPSHSRHFTATQNSIAFGAKRTLSYLCRAVLQRKNLQR
jgi:hypothetical protein